MQRKQHVRFGLADIENQINFNFLKTSTNQIFSNQTSTLNEIIIMPKQYSQTLVQSLSDQNVQNISINIGKSHELSLTKYFLQIKLQEKQNFNFQHQNLHGANIEKQYFNIFYKSIVYSQQYISIKNSQNLVINFFKQYKKNLKSKEKLSNSIATYYLIKIKANKYLQVEIIYFNKIQKVNKLGRSQEIAQYLISASKNMKQIYHFCVKMLKKYNYLKVKDKIFLINSEKRSIQTGFRIKYQNQQGKKCQQRIRKKQK
ncbi:hypothetical protein ABPG74_013684 [Tetrahymena malaccensis]